MLKIIFIKKLIYDTLASCRKAKKYSIIPANC